MEIEDKIYGGVEIKEKVLINLINCNSVQRLKGIAQLGVPQEYYHKKGFSRYEHSLGVMILLRKLGANLEEQVAGLLHDVSHTTFSHVIDGIFGDPSKEDYQDKIHLDVIKNSEIPKILMNHGFDYEDVSKFENFSLLEKEAPSLCADRIDYSLRELEIEKGLDFVYPFFTNLSNHKSQIVFSNSQIAEDFGREYMRLQNEHWGGDQARVRYHILSEILKEALNKEIIKFEDFRKTDDYVLDILNNEGNDFISDNLKLLRNGLQIKESKEGIELKKKFRYVDPEVIMGNSYERLSNISPSYNSFIESNKKNSKLVNLVEYF